MSSNIIRKSPDHSAASKNSGDIKPHGSFKPGEGYGSGESSSDYQHGHRSPKQLGDNPASGAAGRKKLKKHTEAT